MRFAALEGTSFRTHCINRWLIDMLSAVCINFFCTLPLEVKSGKDYTKHRALNHVLESPNYHIQNAIVFCNENIEVKDQVFYCPIYMAGFLEKRTVPEDYIYTLDLSILQD